MLNLVLMSGYYGYGYSPYGFYFDYTYILVLIGFALCSIASLWVHSAMKKYHGVRNARNMTGAEATERILAEAGIYDVSVECLGKGGGDHYDPRTKTVRLSYENYNYSSVTALAVAAHECGHAKQHAESYAPLSIRAAMVPIVNLGSTLGMPLILIGVLFSWNQVLINIGIWAFSLAVLFQLITLPVEFNASGRALKSLEAGGLLGNTELSGARKVLTAAALTYVAALASSILQVLRLVMLFGGNRRED